MKSKHFDWKKNEFYTFIRRYDEIWLETVYYFIYFLFIVSSDVSVSMFSLSIFVCLFVKKENARLNMAGDSLLFHLFSIHCKFRCFRFYVFSFNLFMFIYLFINCAVILSTSKILSCCIAASFLL